MQQPFAEIDEGRGGGAALIDREPQCALKNPQSWNGYAYAGNNPATNSDPSGLMYPGDMPEPHGKTPNLNDGCRKYGCPSGTFPGDHGSPRSNPRYPFDLPGEYNGASPAVRKTILMHLVDSLKYTGGQRYDQALAAFCTEFQGDAMCGTPSAKTALAILGMLPGPPGVAADAATGVDQARHGDWAGLGATLFFAIPLIGDIAEAGRVEKLLKEERALAKACGGNSFIPGTQVLMADGKHKNIEDVHVGDKVLATDPTTGKTTAEPVIASFGGTNYTNLIQITVDTDGKHGHHTGAIIATEHHKLWNQTRHTWTRADQLTPGTKVRTPHGKTLRVIRTAPRADHPAVRDLTVMRVHTYYVLAGGKPVLVHNSGPGCGTYWMSPDKLPHHYMRTNNEGVTHAEDFGIKGPYNKVNGQALINAIQQLVNNPGTRQIQGTFRGQPAIHFVDDKGLHASFAANGPNVGEYLGGWQSSGDQLTYLLRDGKL